MTDEKNTKSKSNKDCLDKIRKYCKRLTADNDAITFSESDLKELSTNNITVNVAYLYKNPKTIGYGKITGYFEHKIDNSAHVWKFYYDCLHDKMEIIRRIECDMHGNVYNKHSSIGREAIANYYMGITSQNTVVNAMSELIESVRNWFKSHKEKFGLKYVE